MSLTFGSVCSGIEAASVAWERLGWRCAFVSEIEAFPRAVLRHRFPHVPLRGDFTEIQAGDHDPIDVLVGGTPCQSFSVAGLRKGLADERGNLALEYLRLADRLRPRWLVWENVPGVLSSSGGRDFGAFLGGLAELGYGFAWRVLDAQHFGLAQRRKRVFVVAHLGDWRRAAAVLLEPASLRGHPPPRREAGEVAPTLPSRGAAGGGLGTDFDCDGGLQVARCLTGHPSRLAGQSETFITADTLTVGANQTTGFATDVVAHALRGEGFDASEDGTGRGTPLVPVCFSPNDDGGGAAADLSPTMRCGMKDGPAVAFAAESGAKQQTCLAFNSTGHGWWDEGDAAATLRAQDSVTKADTLARHGHSVRRLTPRECERLQGFPDDWTRIPQRRFAKRRITKLRPADRWDRDGDGWMLMAADGPRYKALGNSMAVSVMRWIGARIAKEHAA